MAKTCGTLVIWGVDGSQIAHTTDATMTIDRDVADATTKDSGGSEEHLENCGLRSYEGSFDGLAEWDTGGNVDTLYDYIDSRSDVSTTFGCDNGIQFDGMAALTNLEFGAPNEDAATLSGSFKFNGTPTKTDNSGS